MAIATSAIGAGALRPTLNDALLLTGLVSFRAPVVAAPVTPVEVCKKLIEAVTTALAVTFANGGVANVTDPLAGL